MALRLTGNPACLAARHVQSTLQEIGRVVVYKRCPSAGCPWLAMDYNAFFWSAKHIIVSLMRAFENTCFLP